MNTNIEKFKNEYESLFLYDNLFQRGEGQQDLMSKCYIFNQADKNNILRPYYILEGKNKFGEKQRYVFDLINATKDISAKEVSKIIKNYQLYYINDKDYQKFYNMVQAGTFVSKKGGEAWKTITK